MFANVLLLLKAAVPVWWTAIAFQHTTSDDKWRSATRRHLLKRPENSCSQAKPKATLLDTTELRLLAVKPCSVLACCCSADAAAECYNTSEIAAILLLARRCWLQLLALPSCCGAESSSKHLLLFQACSVAPAVAPAAVTSRIPLSVMLYMLLDVLLKPNKGSISDQRRVLLVLC
jgi:hypothetical protein